MTQAVSTSVHRPQVPPPIVEHSSLEINTGVVAELSPSVQLCFSQRKIEELQKRKKPIENRPKTLHSPQSRTVITSENQQTSTVHCQCGFHEDDGAMVSNWSLKFTQATNIPRFSAHIVVPGNTSPAMDI